MTSLIAVEWLNRHLATEITSIVAGGHRFATKELAPRVCCADGYSVSVQASETAYCKPRLNLGPWWQVECGFAMYPEGTSPIPPDLDAAAKLEAELAAGNDDAMLLFNLRRAANRHLFVFVEDWREWSDDGDRGDTVYGYVPIERVVEWINAHGGVAELGGAP